MARQDSGLHGSATSPSLRLELDIFFFFKKLNEQHILAEEGADAASVGFAFLIYFYRHVGQCCLGSSRAGLWACCSRHGAGVAEAPPRIRLSCCCFLLSLALVLLSSPPGSSSCGRTRVCFPVPVYNPGIAGNARNLSTGRWRQEDSSDWLVNLVELISSRVNENYLNK